MTRNNLPLFATSVVIKGFGRGSKELGIPTANFEQAVVDKFSSLLETGVYFGWASVDKGDIHKMVMSVGWNPFYKNIHKSMEVHIMHNYPKDFYGSDLSICVAGYIRPELDFKSVDDLITTIRNDIAEAETQLQKEEYLKLKLNDWWQMNTLETNGSS